MKRYWRCISRHLIFLKKELLYIQTVTVVVGCVPKEVGSLVQRQVS
jgi:hypothetical protein